jgi:gamma-glutamyltranspeptidase / glutathione hydrolase
MTIKHALVLLLALAPLTALAQTFHKAAVVSADPLASQIGADVLVRGGNAMDAAVATFFMLAVTYPEAGNLGGGGFLIIRTESGEVAALDFREMAPLRAHRDMYLDSTGAGRTDWSQRGPLASGVPGSVKGMAEAHQRYGSMPWRDVLAPAIRTASDGYAIPAGLASSLNAAANRLREHGATSFLKTDGSAWVEGDLFRQPDLAQTLKRIADEGPQEFYTGRTASLIDATMRRLGGILTTDDLSAYRAIWRTPMSTEWRGHTLHQMPLPSSGAVVIPQVLRFIDPYDLSELGQGSAETIHLLSEAFRRSFADRNHHLGDPDTQILPLDGLLEAGYLADRWSDYDPGHASQSADISAGAPESPETTHFSVIDAAGNAVAITTTLNGSYGSYVEVAGAGFLLNNEMDDFSIQPGVPNLFGLVGTEANAIAPGKRMLSSMSPTIVEVNGHVRMVLGAAGGPRIITAVVQLFLNGAVYGQSAADAIAFGRFHHQHLPDRITADRGFLDDDTRYRLRMMGHAVEPAPFSSKAHILFVNREGGIEAAADPRGYGTGAGY